jgi:hypothetical protein
VHNDAFSNYGAGGVALIIIVETNSSMQKPGATAHALNCCLLGCWQHLSAGAEDSVPAGHVTACCMCWGACFAAGVALSLDGRLLIVGAPTAWDNNMDCQSGAVYLIDVDEVQQ